MESSSLSSDGDADELIFETDEVFDQDLSVAPEDKTFWRQQFLYTKIICFVLYLALFITILVYFLVYPVDASAPITVFKAEYEAFLPVERVSYVHVLGYLPMIAFIGIPSVALLYYTVLIFPYRWIAKKEGGGDQSASGTTTTKNGGGSGGSGVPISRKGIDTDVWTNGAIEALFEANAASRAAGIKFILSALLWASFVFMTELCLLITDLPTLLISSFCAMMGLLLIWYYENFIVRIENRELAYLAIRGIPMETKSSKSKKKKRFSPYLRKGIIVSLFLVTELFPTGLVIAYFALYPEKNASITSLFVMFCLYFVVIILGYFMVVITNLITTLQNYLMVDIALSVSQAIFIFGGMIAMMMDVADRKHLSAVIV